jgi:alpha-glucosidase
VAPAADTSADWWREAVVYQVYPRSFQDSDGDGLGDLEGITSRLDYLDWLGVDALWISPFYPSPDADLGYDVSDYTAVDPRFGTLADFDRLVGAAHERGLRVLLDLVPSHTSIEHPWFREHPERYVWAEDGPPNNWVAAFGGPAWSRDPQSGRWYLHSFYPEQPDLDWSRPDVREAFAEVVRFWLGRGVDGFRVDAVERLGKDRQLRDDPPASEPFGLPLPEEYARVDHRHSANAPEIGIALTALREAAGSALLVGEVYLPTARVHHYLEYFDLAFAFEFLHAPPDAGRLTAVIDAATRLERLAWVLSNHDFPRLASRFGSSLTRGAAMILLTLPGAAFLYQGDEIGMPNGPGAQPQIDRAGRDPFRHPMQWDSSPSGGFTTGRPWLEPRDPERRNVADQRGDAGSMLSFYRELIEVRRELGSGFGLLDAPEGVVAYKRGDHVIAVNVSGETTRLPWHGEVLVATGPVRDRLEPGAGVVLAGG